MTYGDVAIAAAKNWARNPRPASLNYLATSGGATVLLASDRVYAGPFSVYATLPAGGAVEWFTGAAGSLGGVLTGVARSFAVAVRLSGPATPKTTRLRLYYADGTYTSGPALTDLAVPAGTGFARYALGFAASDPAKTLSRVSALVSNVGASAASALYLGGLDVRDGTEVDAFVCGGLPPWLVWDGTPDDSTSSRLAHVLPVVRGKGGQVRPSRALYLVSRQNVVLDDLSDHLTDATVTYDLEADTWKGTSRIGLDRPDLVDPFADQYLRPHLRIDYPDGSSQGGLDPGGAGSLGLFGVDVPKERWDGGQGSWDYDGKDLLWVLNETGLPKGYILQTGYPYRKAVEDVIQRAGFSLAQTDFPWSAAVDQTANTDFGAERGGSSLGFVSRLIEAMAWLPLWVRLDGKFTSRPIPKLTETAASVRYATGENSPVRWPFDADPDTAAVGNQVTVSGKRRGGGWIEEVVENTDPAHPFSIPRLGRTVTLPAIAKSVMKSSVEARIIGQKAIEDAGMLPVLATLITQPDLRGLREVYELDLRDCFGDPIEVGQGKYFCLGWSLTLSGDWLMTHSLKRVVPIVEILS